MGLTSPATTEQIDTCSACRDEFRWSTNDSLGTGCTETTAAVAVSNPSSTSGTDMDCLGTFMDCLGTFIGNNGHLFAGLAFEKKQKKQKQTKEEKKDCLRKEE